MKYFPLVLLLSAASVQAADTFQDKVKDIFQRKTAIDYADWYKKGDMNIAEFQGETYTIPQQIKVSMKKNEINIKTRHLEGEADSDIDKFARATSYLCASVFEPFVYPGSENNLTWDDDRPLQFMIVNKLRDAQDDPVEKNVNGWKIRITRSAMSTSCSLKKN